MGYSQSLTMRSRQVQGQSLVMTAQLSQSIKLLTMSNIELAAFIESEIERNPFLERQENESFEPVTHKSVSSDEPRVELALGDNLPVSAQALSDSLGTSVENAFPDEQDYRNARVDTPESRDFGDHTNSRAGLSLASDVSSIDVALADITANQVSLRDHLIGQISMSGEHELTCRHAESIIDCLDDIGYLRQPMDELARILNCDPAQAETALTFVQTLEPSGIGARSLEDCLRLQLADRNRLDPAMDALVSNLALLAKRDFQSLERVCNMDSEDLHDAIGELQALDPKPALAFSDSDTMHVVPDVIVREAQDGSWLVELNGATLPRVLVDNIYAQTVNAQTDKSEDKDFVNGCLQNASWLTRSLDQRAQTILKVMTEIVKQQDAFLVHGVRKLRPITLQMVADAIEMHESTVSRVTSNKYVMTPRGLFELKYFFTTSLGSTVNGDNHSSEAVRDRIRGLVDAESYDSVLSDDAILKALRSGGIDIARRTVAKYRDLMRIPSSVQRRREKQAMAAETMRQTELASATHSH